MMRRMDVRNKANQDGLQMANPRETPEPVMNHRKEVDRKCLRQSTLFKPERRSDTLNCTNCMQPIVSDRVCAMGKSWHPEHFVCFLCSKVLSGEFFEEGGNPHCSSCYSRAFCCTICKKPIFESFFSDPIRGKIHSECFKTPIKTCHTCQKLITNRSVVACDKSYHPDCFRCSHCRADLDTLSSFYVKENNPVCSRCVMNQPPRLPGSPNNGNSNFNSNLVACEASPPNSICARCKKGVTGGSIQFESNIYHTDCFTCQCCYNDLVSYPFFQREGKVYCETCAILRGPS
eukprot:TRINITY_DN7124_c0_g1_i1.p1 TRINITY_DN7124_c0_g1~~TRINITY_DN7124_c0_g1_i1.p1  ORF type:complete len:305 (-),score=40.89 TRINITY_DN7124_c0_g1_i1:21-887(-)